MFFSLVTSLCGLLAQPRHGKTMEDLREEVQMFVEKSRETKFDVERLNKLELLDQVCTSLNVISSM